jgi:hypothetical protein
MSYEDSFPYARKRLLDMWGHSVDNPDRSLAGKLMSLEIQEEFCYEDEKKVYTKIAKRKRNTVGEYTVGQKKTETIQLKSITWFSAHMVKIKEQITKVRAKAQEEKKKLYREQKLCMKEDTIKAKVEELRLRWGSVVAMPVSSEFEKFLRNSAEHQVHKDRQKYLRERRLAKVEIATGPVPSEAGPTPSI